ncbi:MAG: radical SAM protein [Candidatus Shapirobacteria bacterium]|jgi:MoaA/NifB/PqqE/SkfB family radical SAM enzyme
MRTESTILSLAIYLTDKCNLHCKHCFLKASPRKAHGLDWNKVKTILKYYRRQNYQIVEFTGGEACLSPLLQKSVNLANKLNYPYIGINSNGITTKVIDSFNPTNIYKITYSLDGASPKTHDFIRGKGTYAKTMSTIKKSISRGFRTEIIFTVNKVNQSEIKKVILLLDKIGVAKLSFNCISPIGNANENPSLLITPQEWVKARKQIEKTKNLKNLTIRFPLMYATPSEFDHLVKDGYQCLLANSAKAEIHPDSHIYHCCLTIENPKISCGKVQDRTIIFDKSSEIRFLNHRSQSPCPARLDQTCDNFIPICVYYKKVIQPSNLEKSSS